jgi:hypothetical protein
MPDMSQARRQRRSPQSQYIHGGGSFSLEERKVLHNTLLFFVASLNSGMIQGRLYSK